MNTPVLFLLGAVALSALGGMVVWIASRPRPEKFGSSIETFNRDLDALAPPGAKTRNPPRARSVAGPKTSKPTAPQLRRAPAPQQPVNRQKPGPRPQTPR